MPAVINHTGGELTFRVTNTEGGYNSNFFMLAPAVDPPPPRGGDIYTVGAGPGVLNLDGANNAVDTSTDGSNDQSRQNVDITNTETLDAGSYKGTIWSYQAGQMGSVIPYLASATGDGGYQILAVGTQVDVDESGLDVDVTVPFGGSAFTLTDGTEVFGGIMNPPGIGSQNPVSTNLGSGGFMDHDNNKDGAFTLPTVGGIVDGFGHANLGRSYAFSIEIESADPGEVPDPPASPTDTPLNIAFVSFHGESDTPTDDAAAAGFTEASDKGYTDLLEAVGHTVTRVVTSNSPDVDALNQFDLVIISRAVSSGHYRNDGATGWTSVTTPSLILGAYVLRTSRMGFTSGTTMVDSTDTISLNVNNSDHPIFAGVELDGSGTMVNSFAEIITFNDIVQRGVSVNNNDAAAGGTVLATVANEADPTFGGLVIGEWQAGATLANDAANVLAGPRVVLLTGSREQGFTSQGAGIYDLVGDGAQLFLNSVDYTGSLGISGPGESISISTDADGNVVVTWTGLLQSAPDVTGPWTDAADDSQSPLTLTPDEARLFGRAVAP
ncbi:MAG TPA: hypothetical protein EYG38_07010 [Verrucomicrobia bacterium]|nr:hypothetical protein [Verrucomicrobiota bacterium]